MSAAVFFFPWRVAPLNFTEFSLPRMLIWVGIKVQWVAVLNGDHCSSQEERSRHWDALPHGINGDKTVQCSTETAHGSPPALVSLLLILVKGGIKLKVVVFYPRRHFISTFLTNAVCPYYCIQVEMPVLGKTKQSHFTKTQSRAIQRRLLSTPDLPNGLPPHLPVSQINFPLLWEQQFSPCEEGPR